MTAESCLLTLEGMYHIDCCFVTGQQQKW